MTAPKLTDAQRIGKLVPIKIANRGPNGQRPGPAWFVRWNVVHEGGACTGCSDGSHQLAMTKSGARAWAESRGIALRGAS